MLIFATIIGVILALPFCATEARECFAWVSRDVNKGNEFYQKNRYEDALKRYEKARDKAPDSDIINYNLGTTQYKLGDYKKAEDSLRHRENIFIIHGRDEAKWRELKEKRHLR